MQNLIVFISLIVVIDSKTKIMTETEYLKTWAVSYKQDLIDNIMPFWLHYGLDHKYGGIYTCLNRNGSLIDTTKSVWFQGRFGFIAAFAYNQIEKRRNG